MPFLGLRRDLKLGLPISQKRQINRAHRSQRGVRLLAPFQGLCAAFRDTPSGGAMTIISRCGGWFSRKPAAFSHSGGRQTVSRPLFLRMQRDDMGPMAHPKGAVSIGTSDSFAPFKASRPVAFQKKTCAG